MQRNVKPIAINADAGILSEITVTNFDTVVILYELNKDNKLTHFEILLKADADKKIKNNQKYFSSKRLINILDDHFNGKLDDYDSICGICYEKNSIEFAIPCMSADSICSDCLDKVGKKHPFSNEKFTHYISFDIIEYLKTLKPTLKDGLDDDNPDVVVSCLKENKEKIDYILIQTYFQNPFSCGSKALLQFVKYNNDPDAYIEYSKMNAVYLASKVNAAEIIAELLKSGCNAIHKSINDIYEIETLLMLGLNPDEQDKHGHTPMYFALVNNNPEAVELLAQYNARLSMSGIGAALNLGKSAAVNKILENDKNYLLTHRQYIEILTCATRARQFETIKLLLKKNFSPNEFDSHNACPLDIALLYDYPEIIELFFQNSALPDKASFERAVGVESWAACTAYLINNPDPHPELYEYAVKEAIKSKNTESTQMFIKAYFDSLNHGESFNYSLLINALINSQWNADKAYTMAAKENQLEVMQAITKIYNPQPFPIDGNLPIHFAVENMNADMVDFLKVGMKTSLDVLNFSSQTPIAIALMNNNEFITILLLAKGASYDDHALLIAIKNKSWKAATKYIEYIRSQNKLNIDHPLLFNNESILIAALKDNEKSFIFQYMLSDLMTLDFAITCGIIHELELAIMDLDQKLENGLTPLQFAYKTNNVSAMGTLLQNNAKPDYEILVSALANKQVDIAIEFITHNKDSNATHFYLEKNLLVLSAISNSLPLIKLLIEKGCCQIHGSSFNYNLLINLLENSQWNADKVFTSAAKENQLEVMQAITKIYNPLPFAIDGNLPIHFAVDHNNVDMLNLLIVDIKVNLNEINSHSQTPVAVALMSNNKFFTILLLANGASFDDQALLIAIENNFLKAAKGYIEHINYQRIYEKKQVNIAHPLLFNNEFILMTALQENEIWFIFKYMTSGLMTLEPAIKCGIIHKLELGYLDLDQKLENGLTPLQFAYKVNNASAIGTLLKNYAKPDYEILVSAILKKQTDIVMAFLYNDPHINPMPSWRENYLLALATLLSSNHVRPYYDLLIQACESNDINWDFISIFIKNNPVDVDMDQNCKNAYMIVFLTAARNSKTEIMEILYQKGYSPDNYPGTCALSAAIENNSIIDIKKLFSRITCPDEIIKNGIAHLDHALDMKNPDIILLLLTFGLTPDLNLVSSAIKNKEFDIAYHFATACQILLNNEECRKTYLEELNPILTLDHQHKLVHVLLPVLFLNLITDIKNNMSENSKISMKGTLLNQYIEKFTTEKIIFNNQNHIENILRKIIRIALQRENSYAFFGATKSADALCELLAKPEYKYFLKMICDDKNETLDENDLIAYVLGISVNSLNSAVYKSFDSVHKDNNYSQCKFG